MLKYYYEWLRKFIIIILISVTVAVERVKENIIVKQM